jgi:hypothetical protein
VRISDKHGYFGEFTCLAMRVLNGEAGRLELTLDRESAAPAGSKASNPRRNGAGFKILNCTLGNCRSRAVLVKGNDGLIEGCTISGCGMSAISIGPEYYWNEADYSWNVTVRGNVLRNNVLNGSDAGTVYVHGDGAIGNRDIVIASNLFEQNHGRNAVYVEDTDGLVVSNNRFIQPPLPLSKGKSRNILSFATTRNVVLRQNKAERCAANDVLVNLGKDVLGIVGNDASGISR